MDVHERWGHRDEHLYDVTVVTQICPLDEEGQQHLEYEMLYDFVIIEVVPRHVNTDLDGEENDLNEHGDEKLFVWHDEDEEEFHIEVTAVDDVV